MAQPTATCTPNPDTKRGATVHIIAPIYVAVVVIAVATFTAFLVP